MNIKEFERPEIIDYMGPIVSVEDYKRLYHFAESEIDRLKSENEKTIQRLDKSLYCMKQKDDEIETLRAKCKELEVKITDFPDTPISCAEWLISAEYSYKMSGLEKAIRKSLGNDDEGDFNSTNVYTTDELKQIAEHLLVYCNHVED